MNVDWSPIFWNKTQVLSPTSLSNYASKALSKLTIEVWQENVLNQGSQLKAINLVSQIAH